jgi:hypothetical protein
MVTPAAASRPGLASDRLRSSTLDRLVNSGPMMTGIDAAAIWSASRCGPVIDHQVIPELPGHPHRGRDVIGPVAVLPPRDLPAQHPAERLEFQVAFDHRPFGRRIFLQGRRGQFRLVVLGRHERAADHRGGAEPGRGRLVPFPVDALGVLAQRRLQPGGLA